MKATMSKDGITRMNVVIKKRLSLWDLLMAACAYTEAYDKELRNATEIVNECKSRLIDSGEFWTTDIWDGGFIEVCDAHFEYYIGILSKYFNERDIIEANKDLEMQR